ncbi:MAG: aldo/keto reductase, partial [Candidatus Puniceispirillaceae bacterium]
MQTKKLGWSSLEVSKLCLGTMTWGEQTTPEEGWRQL